MSADITWFKELGRVLATVREPDERLDQDALDLAERSLRNLSARPESILFAWLAQNPDIDVPLVPIAPELFVLYCHTRRTYLERKVHGLRADIVDKLVPPAELDAGQLPAVAPTWGWGLSVAERIGNRWGRVLNEAHQHGLSNADALRTAFAAVEQLQRFVAYHYAKVALDPDARNIDPLALTAFCNKSKKLEELTGLISNAASGVAGCFDREKSDVIQRSLAIEVLTATMNRGNDRQEWPNIEFRRLTPAEMAIYDEDDRFADPNWPAKKLYGERWNHFGAFATKRGRRNDWLWGRLDAAATISNMLFAGADIRDEEKQRLRKDLADAILAEEFGGDQPDELRSDEARVRLAAEADYVTALTPRRLFRDMENDDPGTFTSLTATVYQLAGEIPLAGRLRPFLAAALGIPYRGPMPGGLIGRGIGAALRHRSEKTVKSLQHWLETDPPSNP